MAKYHINPKTGNPGHCAAKSSCPFGGPERHFNSPEATRAAFEKIMERGYPEYPVWNSKINKELNDAIEYERLRQHTNEARREYLLAGWARLKKAMDANEEFTEELFLEVAHLVEPDNKGEYRKIPVTFANGGSSASPDTIPQNMKRLIEFWPLDESDEVKKEWLKQCLWVHGFSDGNGRTAWVLQQALFDTWEHPKPLIDFGF
jgi:hypothetical protein